MLILFTGASTLCGSSPSLEFLIGSRLLQGLAGGAIVPVGMAMVFEGFPPRRRGLSMGVWGLSIMVSPACGPPLAGALTTSSWRWVFLMNVPLGVMSVVMAAWFLRDDGRRSPTRLNGLGLALSVGSFIQLVLLLRLAPSWEWTVATFGLSTTSLLTTVVFVRRCLRSSSPVINLRILAVPTFRISIGLVSSSPAPKRRVCRTSQSNCRWSDRCLH
jgi:DHA2 family multidrug resistance protein